MKKILVHIPSCLWDMICFIPFLLNLKKLNYEISLLEYEDKYIKMISNRNEIYSLYEKNWLIDHYFKIPYSKVKLAKVLIKNYKKYDIFYTAVRTPTTYILWNVFSKKFKYSFKSLNDDEKYNNYIEWMNEHSEDFQLYSNRINIPYNSSYLNRYNIKGRFVTIFVWPFLRSMEVEEWNILINHIIQKGYKIILLWWEREKWIVKHIAPNKSIVNLLCKTTFEEVCSIIKDAAITISANWWIMRLSHFLNKNSISFSTCSWKITHPTVNNKTSYHLSVAKSICPAPCEWHTSEEDFLKFWCKECQFYLTNKECCCKKWIWKNIIKLINRVL